MEASLRPWHSDREQFIDTTDLNGISLIFLDSEGIMRATEGLKEQAFATLVEQISRIRMEHPKNLIIVNAHHPLETVGIHGKYFTNLFPWLLVRPLSWLVEMDQDLAHPTYAKFRKEMYKTLSMSERIIYAAGHEHNLQVFGNADRGAPEYQLVSGAGNTSKVTGVGHTENTRFALSAEGFFELVITDRGVHLSAYDIQHIDPVAQFWLDIAR